MLAWTIIAASVMFLLILVYVLTQTIYPHKWFLLLRTIPPSYAGQANQALSVGEVIVSSSRDIDDYFVFLPTNKVQTLLQEAEGKLLFPQISIAVIDDRPLIIREQQVVMQDKSKNFITVSGLPTGTKLYTVGEGDIGGFIRGGITERDDGKPYAWIKQAWAIEDNFDELLTYFPVPNIGIANNPALQITVHEEMFIYVEQSTHYATLLIESSLPEDLIPGGVSLAVSIAGDDGIFNRLSLQNILTYKGRIVMIER